MAAGAFFILTARISEILTSRSSPQKPELKTENTTTAENKKFRI